MSYYKTFYLKDPIKMMYFFTTDDLQELDGEERFVNFSTTESIEEVRARCAKFGYTEIANPDLDYVPTGVIASTPGWRHLTHQEPSARLDFFSIMEICKLAHEEKEDD